jgi:hypothetical protein
MVWGGWVLSRLGSQRHLVCLMSSVVLLAHDVFRKVLDHSVTVPIGVKHSHPWASGACPIVR